MSDHAVGEEPSSPRVQRIGWWLGLAVAAAIMAAPTPEGLSPAAQRLAAVTALMGVFWVTQALAMEITSLLPLALFPVLGILSAKTVSQSYFSDSSFLYLGGFILALGIERWGLHQRMALQIIAATGAGVRQLVLGFMLATFFLSMWISNTAATLLMLPIALALLHSLEATGLTETASATEATDASSRDRRIGARRLDPHFARFAMAVTLGIGYAATLGGMATLVGTPTNVVYVEVFAKQFPEGPRLSAGQWMAIWTPCSLAFLLFTWVVLTVRLRTPEWLVGFDRQFARQQLARLGPMSSAEWGMLIVFAVTALLWLTRTTLQFGPVTVLPGWESLAERWLQSLGVPAAAVQDYINDSTVAMGMSLLMFVWPIRSDRLAGWQPLMDWRTASRLPWGVLLLFGGGFAIAEACRATGLAEWAGSHVASGVAGCPIWLVIALVCLLVTFLSEFTSNVATANALLPMIAGMAVTLDLDPRLLMLPATLAASCGFMLPISTPPNAIVFGSGRIRLSQMAGYGMLLDVVGVGLIVAATFGILMPLLGIGATGLPDWAR